MPNSPPPADDPLLAAMANLARFHREHEKYYGSAPRETAVALQRHGRALHALADRWEAVSPSTRRPLSPYEGAEDLNDSAAVQLDGVLFLEGEDEPAELTAIKRELRSNADTAAAVGDWLGHAMDASWDVASSLLHIDALADQVGERHRIIANDMQAAAMNTVTAKVLHRAVDVLDRIDFAPAALRADLASDRIAVQLLRSAAELIDHAADLMSDSAGLVHGNERRWRIFRSRVLPLLGDDAPTASG